MATERKNLSLFLVSVLTLLLELIFIRWIGTEVRIFAYLQNTVLVVCFLGLGIGCLRADRLVSVKGFLQSLLILVFLLSFPFCRFIFGAISELLSTLEDFLIWSPVVAKNPWQAIGYPLIGLGLSFALLWNVANVFIPLGQFLGALFKNHPRIIFAYSINIAGSLVGVWLFVGLNAASMPPVVWLFVACLFLLGLISVIEKPNIKNKRKEYGLVLLILAMGSCGMYQAGALEVIWSPYQKLVLFKNTKLFPVPVYVISVNNSVYQEMLDLSDEHLAQHHDKYRPELQGSSQYDLPCLFHSAPKKVLIVGAGSGNDAAGLLRCGVKDITAVDIDPVIIELGKKYHPEKPYQSPYVRVVNDDARAFFASTTEQYDLIIYGLLDSHTTTSLTNARLDHYVYTRESFERARQLLAPKGVLFLSFFTMRQFVRDRFAHVLREVFRQDPVNFSVRASEYGRGGEVFVTGDLEGIHRQIQNNAKLNNWITFWRANPLFLEPVNYNTPLATDDWPYLYLRQAMIPVLFYLLAGMLLLLFVRVYGRKNTLHLLRTWTREHWHFFFMGAAFLLLEVQNISKLSVVLGNTWEVNAVVISAVLLMILCANFVAARCPKLPVLLVYLCLLATCGVLYFIDLAQFAFLPYHERALTVGLLTAFPIFFSGLVFIRSFSQTKDQDTALGANLFGSLIGGVLQSLTYLTGIKMLLLLVAMLYCGALVTRPKSAAT